MQIIRKVFMLAILLVFSLPALTLGAESLFDPRTIYYEVDINPRGTYFRTCDDHADLPTLVPIGNDYNTLQHGDWVVLRRMGFYQPGPGRPDSAYDLVGVFSSYYSLKPDEVTTQNRLKDSIEADSGYHFATQRTWNECVEEEGEEAQRLSTDIPHDFFIYANMIQIPSGAEYLMLSTNSALHYDNSDPDHNFRFRFTDEVRWAGRAGTNWSTDSNWDTWYAPRPELGVTFDKHGDTLVSGADAEIKYLRIDEGDVRFDSGTDLRITTSCIFGEKSPFIVGDGSKMFLTGGRLSTCKSLIGNEGYGELNLWEGSYVNSQILIVAADQNSSGGITVHGSGTILNTNTMEVAPESSGYLTIQNGGKVIVNSLIFGGPTSTIVMGTVKSGGSLEGQIIVITNATLTINQGIVYGDTIIVRSNGTLRGCNTGFVSGIVTNDGGHVGPGCSTGEFTIDGDYIQKSGGSLEIEISGKTPVKGYDVLKVTGNVTINGKLKIIFQDGFAPKKNDVFEFLQIGGIVTGRFSNVTIAGLQDGFQYDIRIEGGVPKLIALNDGIPKSTVSPIIHLLLQNTDAVK